MSQSPTIQAKLQTFLDTAPALVRTPYSPSHNLPMSQNQAGPSFSDKGKAKEILHTTPAPEWYPNSLRTDDEDYRLEGGWWGSLGKDESYMACLPAVPVMASPDTIRRRRIPVRRCRPSLGINGDMQHQTPPLVPTRAVSLSKVVHRSVDRLCEARRVVQQIQDFQRIQAEGGQLSILHPVEDDEWNEREKQERIHRRRRRKDDSKNARKRRIIGRETGEPEAVMVLKKNTASMLAHAGFEGTAQCASTNLTLTVIRSQAQMRSRST